MARVRLGSGPACVLLAAALLGAALFGEALFGEGSAAGAGRVVGGRSIEVQAAPWTVLVREQLSSARLLCTGSIIDARHVLTAAHCVYDEAGTLAAPAQLSVEAGVSNSSAPLPSDTEQDRTVSSLRVHPGYAWSSGSGADDVAVLALARPLDLAAAAVRAVALPAAGAPFPAGAAVGLAGFGRERAADAPSGALAWMSARVDPQGSCGAPASSGVIANNAVALCASSAASATCNGDSGAGLVTTGSASPTLVGVVSGGPASCQAGSHTLYSYLGAGELLSFVEGAARPARAPRKLPSTFVNLSWQPPLVVGAPLRCDSGGWGVRVRLDYAFFGGAGRLLQSGAGGSYVLRASDLGARVYCRVAASNHGGTTIEQTNATAPIAAAPRLRLAPLAPLAAVRGNPVALRVTFHAPAGLAGRFGACVTPPAGVGHRACSSLPRQHGGRGSFSFVLSFRVEPSALAGPCTLVLHAFAGAAAASATARLQISRAGR